jgi:hypothetical protein
MNRKIPVPFLGGWRALLPSSYPTHLWAFCCASQTDWLSAT